MTLVSARVTKRFQSRMTVVFETRIATLQAEIPTLEHQERASVLDRLAVLRNETYVLDHMYATAIQALTWTTRIISVLILLASVNPAMLALLVALIPVAAVSLVRPVSERRAEERAAPHKRLSDHLHRVLTSAESSKDVRVFRLDATLTPRRRAAWNRWHRTVARGRNLTAMNATLAWSVFFAATLAVLALVTTQGVSPGNAVILLLGAQQLGNSVSMLLSEAGYIRGTWMEGAIRMAWLETYAHAASRDPDHNAMPDSGSGIRARSLTFRYPGASAPALDGINLDIPPGTVVAIVGDNGAGKSTLVKLLAGYYSEYTGTLEAGGVSLNQTDIARWRSRLSGSFQDFSRFELPVRESIGLGELGDIQDDTKIAAAARRAGTHELISRLPRGLRTQLGRQWPGGVDLSGGEWQKIALARSFMRRAPMIRFLDEPTSALDADTEYEIFSSYAENSTDPNLITILVSHRFSTVSMADHVIVMDGARIVEQGSHDQLIRLDGLYADLYAKQARAYAKENE